MLKSPVFPALLAGLAGLALPGAALAETARGAVFEDLNGDGVRGAGEPGVAGVAVSNGRDVVATGEDGTYRIAVEPRDVLFITKPSGYAVPVNDDNLPQFYYIHDPDGTPESLGLRYAGVEPTGPLPAAIDFPLIRQSEPDTFSAVLLADTQPQSFKELDYIRDDVVAELAGTDAAFGITAGDILFDDMAMFPRYNAIIGQIGVPWYNVPGNHEMNFLSPDDDYSLETFKRHFGPTSYSFAYAGVHFVIMDNVDYLGRDAGREEPHPRGAGSYEGRLSQDQLDWLAADLAFVPEDKLVVLVMHIPLTNYNRPDVPSVSVENRRALFRILSDRKHLISFAGHLHTTEIFDLGPKDGFRGDTPLRHHTLATVSGAWWSGPADVRGIPQSLQSDGVPNGYNILTVSGSDATVRFVPAGRPATDQMRISFDSQYHNYSAGGWRDYPPGALLGSPISIDQVYSTDVVVNFYNGALDSVVTYEIGGFEPVVMTRTTRPSPLAEEMIARHQDSYKSWVTAAPSRHIWTARLPRDLPAGTHTVTVRGTDAYGLEHVSHRVLEVTRRD